MYDYVFFDGDDKNFSKYFQNCPQKFLCVFFNRKMIFVLKQTFLKIQVSQIIIFEKVCQILKVRYFRYIDKHFRLFPMHF